MCFAHMLKIGVRLPLIALTMTQTFLSHIPLCPGTDIAPTYLDILTLWYV